MADGATVSEPVAVAPAEDAVGAEQTADGGSALRSRDFRLYQMARLVVILGAAAQSVAGAGVYGAGAVFAGAVFYAGRGACGGPI